MIGAWSEIWELVGRENEVLIALEKKVTLQLHRNRNENKRNASMNGEKSNALKFGRSKPPEARLPYLPEALDMDYIFTWMLLIRTKNGKKPVNQVLLRENYHFKNHFCRKSNIPQGVMVTVFGSVPPLSFHPTQQPVNIQFGNQISRVPHEYWLIILANMWIATMSWCKMGQHMKKVTPLWRPLGPSHFGNESLMPSNLSLKIIWTNFNFIRTIL